MIRWLAADETMPGVTPQTYQLPEIVLTSRQMRDVFIALEVLLPLSTHAVRRLGVVEAAVNAAPRRRGGAMRLVAPLAAALLIVLLAAITISGHWPELQQIVHFAGKGLVASAPSRHHRRSRSAPGRRALAFAARAGGWTIDGMTAAVPAELASHIDIGLRLLHVSEPAREIAPGELTPASFAEFGLDLPANVVMLGAADGPVGDRSNFGMLNPVEHLAICPRRRLAHGLSDAAACRHRVAGGGRHGAPLARASRAARWRTADRACCCRCRWRRSGRSRSWPAASSPASSAIAPAIGCGIPGSIRTRPTPSAHVADPAQARIIAAALDGIRRDRSRDTSSAAPPMPVSWRNSASRFRR